MLPANLRLRTLGGVVAAFRATPAGAARIAALLADRG